MKQYRYKMIDALVSKGEGISKRYLTWHTRPIYAADVRVSSEDVVYEYLEFALVMQGPLLATHHFTVETLLLYKKYFPGALIILSTWEGEDKDSLDRIKNTGIEVILNKKPVHAGPMNINFQLISAGVGIRRAAELEKKYVLKTRTDVRIYNFNSLLFLSRILALFPLTDSDSGQKGRLVSIHGRTDKLYYFPDQLVFGYTEDVLLYFGANLLANDAVVKCRDLALLPFHAEQYLFTEFLRKVGSPPACTIEDSSRALAQRGVIVDAPSLDWYWHKYKRYYEFRTLLYQPKKRFLDFSGWLNLYDQYGKQ